MWSVGPLAAPAGAVADHWTASGASTGMSVGTGASSEPVSSAASTASAYCAASTLASSPALDQVERDQVDRCGSIAPPTATHVPQDQVERAHEELNCPGAALQVERVQVLMSTPARLAASISAFGTSRWL